MSRTNIISLDPLLLELFQMLRDAGIALTLDQYDLLRQALDNGYGLAGWEDLRRICRIVWVKPSPNYEAELFDRTFDRFRQRYRLQMPTQPLRPSQPASTPAPDLSALPQVPPRRRPSTQAESPVQAPVAVKTLLPRQRSAHTTRFRLSPRDFPITLEDVKMSWRSLRRTMRHSTAYELDVEATMARIEQEGIFSDVVMQPVRTRQAELVLLIDDSLTMLPFLPALRPFVQAIEENRVTPAQIYRFTTYPDDYLYHWNRPTQAESLSLLLPKFHHNRTVAIIISDAGSATKSYSQEYIEGITSFLLRLSPCVHQILWLNPLPLRAVGTDLGLDGGCPIKRTDDSLRASQPTYPSASANR